MSHSFETPRMQASPSMGFSKQEQWSGWPFPSPGEPPGPGIEPGSPALHVDPLLSEPPGTLVLYISCYLSIKWRQGCQDLRWGMPLTSPQGAILPSIFLPSIWHKLSTVSLSLDSRFQFCNLWHQEHMGSFIKIPTPRPVPTPIELEFQRKSPSSSGWLESRAESENHSR